MIIKIIDILLSLEDSFQLIKLKMLEPECLIYPIEDKRGCIWISD